MSKPSVVQASWRGTTRFCATCGEIDLSFQAQDGTILRLRLTEASVAQLMASLVEARADQMRRDCASPCTTVNIINRTDTIVRVNEVGCACVVKTLQVKIEPLPVKKDGELGSRGQGELDPTGAVELCAKCGRPFVVVRDPDEFPDGEV